jgi:Phage Mu protein F like protein
MNRTTLALVHAAMASTLAIVAKEHVPGDQPEEHEDNTFGLPEGAPVRRILRRYFRDQLKRVVGYVDRIGVGIPDRFPRMADYDDPMASAMTPVIGAYWSKAGRGLRGRLGLDPDEWRVTDPNIHRAIAGQCLKFCKKTNATTDLGVAAARDAVRDQLARGLIGEGETIPELTARIRTVFAGATSYRAQLIARTETARAVHAASEMSAEASGVVSAKRWMLSANSCPVCVALAEKASHVALGGSFGTVGHDPDYSTVRYPPAHAACRCSISYLLIDESPPVPAYVPRTKPEVPAHAES